MLVPGSARQPGNKSRGWSATASFLFVLRHIFFCHYFDAAIRTARWKLQCHTSVLLPLNCGSNSYRVRIYHLQRHAPGPFMASINQEMFSSLSHMHLDSSIIYLTKSNLHYTIQNLLIMLKSEVCIASILASLYIPTPIFPVKQKCNTCIGKPCNYNPRTKKKKKK